MTEKYIGILIYENVEVLDFSGPFEVLTTARRVADKMGQGFFYIPLLIAPATGPVSARAGYRVLPDHDFDSHPALDCLLVPGGVHEPQLENEALIEWIRRHAAAASMVSSVCTGAFLLAEAGLAEGRHMTTHWEDVADFKHRYPSVTMHENVRWVEDGTMISSAGISAGIDMTLQLVTRLHSEDLAQRTARQMDFDWKRTGITIA